MPFDEQIVDLKVNPFTAEAVIAWLKTKDPKKEYDWAGGRCLWSQYGLDLGLADTHGEAYSAVMDGMGQFISDGGEPFDGLALDFPNTFGAALERLEKIHGKRAMR